MKTILAQVEESFRGMKLSLRRCRDVKHSKDNDPLKTKWSPSYNELVALYYDEKKNEWRDTIRLMTADCSQENLPEYFRRTKITLERLLDRMGPQVKRASDAIETVNTTDEDALKTFARLLKSSRHYGGEIMQNA